MAYKKRHKAFIAGRRVYSQKKDFILDNPGITDFDRWQWLKGYRIALFYNAIRQEEKDTLKEFVERERRWNQEK